MRTARVGTVNRLICWGAHQRVYTIRQRRLDSQIEYRVIPEEE
jgi:hypothetical protein